jgi:hypothetical protein
MRGSEWQVTDEGECNSRLGFLQVSQSTELGSKGRATGNALSSFAPVGAHSSQTWTSFFCVKRSFGRVCFSSFSAPLFDILTAVNMKVTVFWDVTSNRLVKKKINVSEEPTVSILRVER